MRTFYINIQKIFTLLFVLTLIVSCSKDNDKDDEPDNTGDKTVEFKPLTVTSDENSPEPIVIPEKLQNSSNQYAQMCVSYIEMANQMETYLSSFTPPEDAEIISMKSTKSEVVYKWSAQDFNGNYVTYYLTYSEKGDELYYELDIESNDISRVKYMDAIGASDGSWGEMNIYMDMYYGSNEYNFYYSWEYNDDGSFDFYLNNGGLLELYITVNADASGIVDYYIEDIHYYNITWDTEGNGSYTFYDTDGNELDSQEWTVEGK